MPSTVVHVAFAVLLGAALLGAGFDRRAAVLVVGIAIVPDLDAFASIVAPGTHRAIGHTLLIPLLGALLVLADTRLRETAWGRERLGPSWLRGRFGERGVALAWTGVAVYALAGIGLDMVTNGVNPLYPLHDQFYTLSGRVELSTQRGLVQTFVEFPEPEPAASAASGASGGPALNVKLGSGGQGTTEEVFLWTGIDPVRGEDPEDVERIFPVVQSGWETLLVVSGLGVLASRLLPGRE